MSAATDRESVENFLNRTDLPEPNSIFAFDRDGTRWYALVHGLFGSISEATSAVERMPPAAQTNQPWIRKVGRVQNVLRDQN
jgi:septal ring-binding cell division protein DamX